MDTPSDVLMSLSVPGTTITPVPITKLPTINAHSARGKAALEAPVVDRAEFMKWCEAARASIGERSDPLAAAVSPRSNAPGSERESPREHPEQGGRHGEVAGELADGHVDQAGPEGEFQPARHGAQRIAHHRQPAQQTGLGTESLQPAQGARVGGGAMAHLVDRLVGAQAHQP